jgi:hypothetical protein
MPIFAASRALYAVIQSFSWTSAHAGAAAEAAEHANHIRSGYATRRQIGATLVAVRSVVEIVMAT